MGIEVFSSGVTGYKNIIKNKTTQDYCDYKKYNNIIIAALADGHSTEFFEYSHIGSKLGCKAGILTLEEYIYEGDCDIEKVKEDLKNGIIQNQIYEKWNTFVENHYQNNKPLVFRTEHIKYSTTLSIVMICKDDIVYINIGDNTILAKKKDKYMKILGNTNNIVVNSLGSKYSYKKIEYYIENTSDNNSNDYVILCSDGYSDGFNTNKEMIEDLNKTIYKYEKSVFTRLHLYKTYKAHLSKISKNKSKDDITIMFLKVNK